MPPPISVPTSPIRIVSQAGIGSGPGTANRARAPVMNAVTITEMTLAMAASVAGRHGLRRSGVHVLARPRRGGRDELAEQHRRGGGDLVDRPLEGGLVRL